MIIRVSSELVMEGLSKNRNIRKYVLFYNWVQWRLSRENVLKRVLLFTSVNSNLYDRKSRPVVELENGKRVWHLNALKVKFQKPSNIFLRS